MSINKEEKLKIAIDIRNIGRNRTGSEVVVLQLVKYLLSIDLKNQYKLLTDTTDEDVLRYVRKHLNLADKNNVEIISLKAKNKFVWAAWSVWRWTRKNSVDIYHTEYILPFFMPKSVKLVTHIHDVSFKVYRELISWKDIFFLDFFIPWSIKKADRIIAVSQFTKDEIEKYYPASHGKVDLVYNAVANDFAENVTSESIQGVRQKYNLPSEYILALGTMQPRKNIPFLIKAYINNYKKWGKTKLVLVGKKSHNFDNEIEKMIKESEGNIKDNIVFTGYVDEDDKPSVFAGAKVFVYPSLYEGFGLPPLESLHVGTPLIISDIPPHKEVFDGVGHFFNPKDLEGFSKKLYNFCVDGSQEKDKDLVKAKIKLFSWKNSAKRMLSIFNNL